MLGLAWSCDWLGCSARMVQAFPHEEWGDYWIDGSWSVEDTGWTVDKDRKVWCPVHGLLHEMQSAMGLQLRPPKGHPATVIQDVHALAERYPGELALSIAVPSRYRPGHRTLTLGSKVAPTQELLAGLLEYGPVVVIPGGG